VIVVQQIGSGYRLVPGKSSIETTTAWRRPGDRHDIARLGHPAQPRRPPADGSRCPAAAEVRIRVDSALAGTSWWADRVPVAFRWSLVPGSLSLVAGRATPFWVRTPRTEHAHDAGP